MAEQFDEFRAFFPYLSDSQVARFLEEDVLQKTFFRFMEDNAAPWQYRVNMPWFVVKDPRVQIPEQGWKLHLSATRSNAELILGTVLPILLRRNCHFKFMTSIPVVELLNAAQWSRETGGKFITIYPASLDEAELIAEECYNATQKFVGPNILSDRRYKPDGLVYYRYGSFTSGFVLRDSTYIPAIRDPNGKPVPDERKAWFSPPSWVNDPFNPQQPIRLNSTPPILNHRYVIEGAFKHANKGGVYKAFDQLTGQAVVIKEARPHVSVYADGHDAQWVLHREGSLLKSLSSTRLCPRFIEEFSFGSHQFLVQEYVSGTVLRVFVQHRFQSESGGLEASLVRNLFAKLTRLVSDFHSLGVVIRDFNPNNVIVLDDGDLKVVDLELSARIDDDTVVRGATYGYGSPEQIRGQPVSIYDDYYSLGATMYYVLTGRDPYLIPDLSGRFNASRLWDQISLMIRENSLIPLYAQIVFSAMSEIPEKRAEPAKILELLDDSNSKSFSVQDISTSLSIEDYRQLSLNIAKHLLRTMDLSKTRPWPTTAFGSSTSPSNFQHGVSGVGMFLLAAYRALNSPEIHNALTDLCNWVLANLEQTSDHAPSLYLGLGGTVWFLLETSEALGIEALRERAKELALALPEQLEVPDVTHGAAGLGIAQLKFWHCLGDAVFLQRARNIAGYLTRSAIRNPVGGLLWQIPPELESVMSGKIYYGYAHGNAGILHFFTLLFKATRDPRFLDVAVEAANVLVDAAEIIADCAYWSFGPDEPTKWVHWCNGSSGVGSALLRLYEVTGSAKYLELCRLAANAVMRSKWRSPPVQCHGLAGNGEFLLDLYKKVGDQTFLDMAKNLADIIYSRRVYLGGPALFPDETGMRISTDYGIGYAGVAGFLLRLSQLTPRTLMLDELV